MVKKQGKKFWILHEHNEALIFRIQHWPNNNKISAPLRCTHVAYELKQYDT